MAATCIGEQADCLRNLGRLDEAAGAYEERIRRAEQFHDERGIAVGKGQLATVRLLQARYTEALKAYAEAREKFTRLGEPRSVAASWHQIGIVYHESGQTEAAEDAYRRSLAITVPLGNVGAQAITLEQLALLYDRMGRTEEAISFFRQAIDKYIDQADVYNEATGRSNLALMFRKLGRLDDARSEIQQAIKLGSGFGDAAQPWKSWSILTGIERQAGKSSAAAEANRKAIACYLAYRRGGGENHFPGGRISVAVTQSLLNQDFDAATSFLENLASHPDAVDLLSFVRALQSIVAGTRDPKLADAPELDYTMAAEILFLIETLNK